jgi:hypothetical protein
LAAAVRHHLLAVSASCQDVFSDGWFWKQLGPSAFSLSQAVLGAVSAGQFQQSLYKYSSPCSSTSCELFIAQHCGRNQILQLLSELQGCFSSRPTGDGGSTIMSPINSMQHKFRLLAHVWWDEGAAKIADSRSCSVCSSAVLAMRLFKGHHQVFARAAIIVWQHFCA